METTTINAEALREYVLNKFRTEGDFDFLKEGQLEKMVDALMETDATYQASIGEDGLYDDDVVYEQLFARLTKDFPEYKMYCMRMADDYLDFSEEYLVSIDAIEWE